MKTISATPLSLSTLLALSLAAGGCAQGSAPNGPAVTVASGETITAKDLSRLPADGRLAIVEADGATYRFDARAGSIDYDRIAVRRADGATVPVIDRLAASAGLASMTDDPVLEMSWSGDTMAISHGRLRPELLPTCWWCYRTGDGRDICQRVPCGSLGGAND